MAASRGGPRRSTIVFGSARIALEYLVWENEGLRISRPSSREIAPARARLGAVVDASVQVTTVVALPKPQTRPRPDRIDSTVKSIAPLAHLPLHRSRRGTRKGHGTGSIILGTPACLRRGCGGKITANITGIELDCVEPRIHAEPGRVERRAGQVSVCRPMNSSVISCEKNAGRTGNKG